MPIIKDPLPAISGQSDLARFLEISDGLLEILRKNTESRYRVFHIPKRSGGSRRIEVPQPSLQALQRKILDDILSKVGPHQCAHGFVEGRSIISNAICHLNGRHFLHLDLKNFFGSITISAVELAFSSLGYELPIAQSLAHICCVHGALPQGAPTSPALSNICAENLDLALESVASENDLIYTRYADDITFSGRSIGLTLVTVAKLAIESCGYELNENKTLLARNGGKNIITGISVSNQKLCVPKEFKRAVRLSAHFLIRNGLVAESRRGGIFDPLHVDRVLGRLAYWHQVEPGNAFPPLARIAILKKLNDLKFGKDPEHIPR